MPASEPDPLLRHALATLAYRAGKVVRDLPAALAEQRATPTTRTPRELVSHLADLMRWAVTMARGETRWTATPAASFEAGVAEFLAGLAALDAQIVAAPPDAARAAQLFQGPIADAFTHVGQLALLRGMAGAPVRPESYARAEIVAGRVGREQAPARAEFDGDASWPQKNDNQGSTKESRT
jgi:hypothetical protein